MAITRAGIVPMREFVDVVVIGAGPAGMSAALEALEHGLTVTVLDEQGAPGGQVYRSVLRTDMRRLAVLGTDYEAGKSLAPHRINPEPVFGISNRKTMGISFISYKPNVLASSRLDLLFVAGVPKSGRFPFLAGPYLVS